MAAVEPLGSTDPLDPVLWLVVQGTLREADLQQMLESAGSTARGDVTLDLLNLEHLTSGGCWTIRNVGDRLWHEGRQLRVLYQLGGQIAEMLRSSGTLGDPRVSFIGSS